MDIIARAHATAVSAPQWSNRVKAISMEARTQSQWFRSEVLQNSITDSFCRIIDDKKETCGKQHGTGEKCEKHLL
jgi:hypothetical protein